MPRHHAEQNEQPGSRKEDADNGDRQVPLGAGEARRNQSRQQRRRDDPERHDDRDHQREQRAHRARHPVGLLPVAFGEQARIDGDERPRQRPFAEQILQEIGDAEGGVERVGGVRAQAEIVSEDPKTDQPRKATEQDPSGNEPRLPHHSTSSSAADSPSVPLERFIR